MNIHIVLAHIGLHAHGGAGVMVILLLLFAVIALILGSSIKNSDK